MQFGYIAISGNVANKMYFYFKCVDFQRNFELIYTTKQADVDYNGKRSAVVELNSKEIKTVRQII